MKANTMEQDHYFEFRNVLEDVGEALEEAYRLGCETSNSDEYDAGYEEGYAAARRELGV